MGLRLHGMGLSSVQYQTNWTAVPRRTVSAWPSGLHRCLPSAGADRRPVVVHVRGLAGLGLAGPGRAALSLPHGLKGDSGGPDQPPARPSRQDDAHQQSGAVEWRAKAKDLSGSHDSRLQ